LDLELGDIDGANYLFNQFKMIRFGLTEGNEEGLETKSFGKGILS
jgi:hypothetical protein